MLRNSILLYYSLGFLISTIAGAQAIASESKILRFDLGQLRCVKQNLAKYLASQEEPYLIILPACPIIDPTEAILSLATNSLFNRSAAPTSENDTEIILRVNKLELQCLLARIKNQTTDPLVTSRLEFCND